MREKILLLAAACGAFGLVVAGSFHFDDYALLSDPVITSPDGWWRAWLPLQTRPLTWFSFWINFAVADGHPFWWHAVNLALHWGCVLLAYDAFRRLAGARAAWIAAALFAVHPIATEPVAYVSARGILLATLLCLLSLAAWTRGRYWIAAGCFAGALLAKEECAAFPVFLLALYLALKDTVTTGRAVPGPRIALPGWRAVIPTVPNPRSASAIAAIGVMLAMSLAAGARVIWASRHLIGSGVGQSAGVSAFDYASVQGPVILRYLRMLAIPLGFTPDPEIRLAKGWIAVLAWLAVLGLAAVAVRTFPKARAGFWFLGGLILLLPSSSIFPAADLAADRRMYLPLIAFSMCAALLLARVDRRIAGALIVSLALISVRQCLVWRSEESLWAEAVRLAPGKVRPRIQLARALPWDRAVSVLEDAKRLAPDDPDVASEEGRAHLSGGRPELALAAFGRALALRPNDPKGLNNRGVALMAMGQREAAKADFEAALRKKPCLMEALQNLKTLGVDVVELNQARTRCANAEGR